MVRGQDHYKITRLDKRCTKTDNVHAEFNDEEFGKTEGHLLADKETYGADKLWCILKGIPVDLDSEGEEGEEGKEGEGEDA